MALGLIVVSDGGILARPLPAAQPMAVWAFLQENFSQAYNLPNLSLI
jgi:hypothetical protein